ncbi:DUF4440 domain-containing protein [Microbacterium aurum]
MDLESVRAAEESLRSSAVRCDPSRVRDRLHQDFVEIGRSGRRWSRDEIVAALSSESERAATETDEWHFSELALITYLIRGTDGDSRHSSMVTSRWLVEFLDTVRVSFCDYAAASSGIATSSASTCRSFMECSLK